MGFDAIMMLNSRNIIINGIRTKNQAIPEAPALHIKFRIHVQNRTYANLIAKTKKVLDTLHDCTPKQYVLTFP